MRSVPCVVAILPVLLFASSSRPARAGVPAAVPFQGRLTAPNGQPVADTDGQTLTFRLYDAATGGALLWSQTSSNVHVRGGVFSATLDFSTGFTAPNTLDTALAGTPYVEVQAGDDPPMSPRLPLSSAPYALRTWTADLALTIPDGSITAPKLAPGAVSTTALDTDLGETLSALSVGTAAHPTLVSTTDTSPMTSPHGLAITGGRIYIVGSGKVDDRPQGMLDVFDATGLVPALANGTPSALPDAAARAIAVSAGKAYVTGTSMTVVDVSQPSMPNVLGSTPLVTGNHWEAAYGNTVDIRGNTAYAAAFDHWGGAFALGSFDVSVPTAPVSLGAISSEARYSPRAIVVSGDLAYVAERYSLRVLDVSNPSNLVTRGSVGIAQPPDTGFASLVVSGGLAYICGASGLQIVDVSDPSAPRLLSTTTLNSVGDLVAVSGTLACVVGYDARQLSILDVSNPLVPTVIGTAVTESRPVAVAMSGHTAYVLNDGHTLQKFDLGVLTVSKGLSVAGAAAFSGDVTIAGNLGIGMTPTARLDVNGTVQSTGFNMTSGAATFIGSVGIRTAAPTAPLDVNGTVKSTGLQITSGAALGRVLTSDANGVATWQAPAVPAIPAIVAGEVSFSGGILNGTGFTVARIGGRPVGGYHITFTPPFLATPIVTATPYAEDNDLSATYANPSANGVDILVTLPTQFRDTRFSFIAVGTR